MQTITTMQNSVVMKFGGTSVGSVERITAVAKRVAAHKRRTSDRVAVVVSAMSGETNRLVDLCHEISGERFPEREYHQLLASGEQVTAALTAMALEREGVPSKSILAFQLPIRTSAIYGQHLIQSIDSPALNKLLDEGITPVVAGFQGVAEDLSYATLGRGGSDNTAVALAAALNSCDCYIYTDVEGVYTAQPQLCRAAKKLSYLNYEEMLELASSGAKVLQSRSVSLAHKFKVPLIVCSSFSNIDSPVEGTRIVREYKGMEDAVVSGITCKSGQARFTVRDLPDAPGIAAKLCRAVADAGVVIDMISQSQVTGGHAPGGKGTISLTVSREDAKTANQAILDCIRTEMPEARVDQDDNIAKLSVVGEGMRVHSGVAAEMFEVLGREGINIEMITTSEIKITVAIHEKYAELAVRALHEYFIENKSSAKVQLR